MIKLKFYIVAIIFILSLNTNIFAEVISYMPKENIPMVLPTDTDLIAYKITEFNGEEQEAIDFSYEQLDKFIYNVNNKIPYGINVIYYLKQGDKLSVKDWAYLYFDGEKATVYWYLENDKGEYYFARAIEIHGDVQKTVLQNSEFINIFKKIYLSSDTVGYRFYDGNAYSTPRLMEFPLKDEDKPLEEYKKYETYRYNIEIPKGWTFEEEKNYNAIFKNNNRVCGGIKKLVYNKNTDQISQLYDKYLEKEYKLLSVENITSYGIRKYIVKLNNNDSLGTHIFFIDYTDNNGFSFAYDLYFTDEVDNKTISNIAQSVYIIQIYYTDAIKLERSLTDKLVIKNYNNKATTITDKDDIHKIRMYIAQGKEMIVDDKSTDGYIHNIIEFYDGDINILNCDFYNKENENKYYIYNGNSWFEIENVDSTLTNLFK